MLLGGVVFAVPAAAWDPGLGCRPAHLHTRHLVLIDSISPRRAPTAGRADEAEQMAPAEAAQALWIAFAKWQLGRDHGLTVGIHAHAAGFIDFEPN